MALLHATSGVNLKSFCLELYAQEAQFAHMKVTLHQTMTLYVNYGMKMFGSGVNLMVLDQKQRLPMCKQLDLVPMKVAKQ